MKEPKRIHAMKLRALAVAASCDERTIQKVAEGHPVTGMSMHRAAKVLQAAGFEVAEHYNASGWEPSPADLARAISTPNESKRRPIDALCSAADGRCDRPVAKAGLCWGHWKRRMRGLPEGTTLEDPRGSLTPRELLKRAALNLADVEGADADFTAAEWRLSYAALRYALSIGWTPLKPWRGWKYESKRWTEVRPSRPNGNGVKR